MSSTQIWLPLMEYAMKKGVSLSTLRRYIKANKVRYRIEAGRYLLLDEEASSSGDIPTENSEVHSGVPQDFDLASWNGENTELAQSLARAQEEIAELKMLVSIYEERLQTPSGSGN